MIALPLLHLGQIVIYRVVVRFIGDEYMLLYRELSRHIESPGGNADGVVPKAPPKQIAAAVAAESAFRRIRRAVPDQGRGGCQRDVVVRRARHRRKVSAGAAALRAMARDDPAKRSANPIPDPAAQASTAMHGVGVCQVSLRCTLDF